MQADHQPSSQPHKQPAWESTLLNALAAVTPTVAGHIDCSLLERALSASTGESFTPLRSQKVIERLTQLGIHCIGSDPAGGPEFISQPKNYAARLIDGRTIDFFNGVFSNPHCALYLAPSLLGPLIYSPNRLITTSEFERQNGILSVFRVGFLSTNAMNGMLSELRRHLIIRCTQGEAFETNNFLNYAGALPVPEHEHHRPFFVSHAQKTLLHLLSDGKEVPLEMTRLLNYCCGTRLFQDFPYGAITNWLEKKLDALTVDFDKALITYDRISKSTPSVFRQQEVPENGSLDFSFSPNWDVMSEMEDLEFRIEELKERFQSCLELILVADEGCDPFHRQHLQNGETSDSDDAGTDPEPPANSALLQTLTHCTLSMLAVLGQPGLDVPLEVSIPDNLAQALRARFNWYPEDYPAFESFYQEDLTHCLLRYIAKGDFTSACSLIVIAPPPISMDGRLTMPSEIEEPLRDHQDFICRKIAQKMDRICDDIVALASVTVDDFVGLSSYEKKYKSACELKIETGFEDLKRGISTLLTPESLETGTPEISTSLAKLIMLLAVRNFGRESDELKFGHGGFKMITELMFRFDSPDSTYFAGIFQNVLKSVPEAQDEFSKYVARCNSQALELMSDNVRNPENLASYERQLMRPVRLFQLLPAEFSGQTLVSPADCNTALRLIRRGRELRQEVSKFEVETRQHFHQLTPSDIERQLIAMRENRQFRNGSTSLPLSMSMSLTSHLRDGTLELTPELLPLAGEAQMVIARAGIAGLRTLSASASHVQIMEKVFAGECQLLGAVLPALCNDDVNVIISAANTAREFYTQASKVVRTGDQDTADSMHTLSRAFSFLATQLKPFQSAINGQSENESRRQVVEIIRDFIDHYSIQDLIRVLHLEDLNLILKA